MNRPVLIDTGPLVAFLSQRDEHHSWVVEQWKVQKHSFHTCEAVLAESAFLLRQNKLAVRNLFELVQRKVVVINFSLQKELQHVQSLLERFHSVPISLTDACLIRMSELHTDALTFTLDSDFKIYRQSGRKVIPLIAPW